MRSNRWKMLTGAMRGCDRWLVVALVLGAVVATGHAQVIFTDTFDSGTGNWYQSGTAGTLTTSDNQLSWLRGGQTRETIGRSFSAQSIGVGESIRLTFDFKQNASVGILRAGLYNVGTPIAAGNWAIIAEDPKAEAEKLAPYILHQTNQYIRWGAFGPPESTPEFTDAPTAIENGLYELWTADEAVSHLATMLEQYPQIEDVHFWAQFPGEPVESGTRRLEYIAEHVLPRLK